jgi:hypothetical protein
MHQPALIPGAVAAELAVTAEQLEQPHADGVLIEDAAAAQSRHGALQAAQDLCIPRDLAEAMAAVFGRQLEHDAKRVRRVQPGCIEQRRVAESDGGHLNVLDLHGRHRLTRSDTSRVHGVP